MTMWECPRCGGTLTCYCPPKPTKKEEAMTEFDPSKPVMTRGGQNVELIDRRLRGTYPIFGVVDNEDGSQTVSQWSLAGSFYQDGMQSSDDLVNIPESKWMNLYEDPSLLTPYGFSNPWHESRKDADDHAEYLGEHCESQRVAICERTASGEFITTAVEK